MMRDTERKNRAKNWARAKAHAELDGFILPPVFAKRAEVFVEGSITLEQLVSCYTSLLPDNEILQAMYEQYEPDYIDLRVDDPRSLPEIFAERKARIGKEIVFNEITIKNIMGMQIALGTYKSLLEEKGQGDV